MANFSIKLNLRKINGASLVNLKGRTATKRCLVIPLDDSGLFEGEKGVYLNMTAIEMSEPSYGDTHFIKVNLDREAYEALTEEERRAIPILGGMHELGAGTQAARTAPSPSTEFSVDNSDDLAF